jgi:DEAD/DEAH box helicase domain-containing protein
LSGSISTATKAFVREIDCDYYTDAITYTRVTAIDTFERQPPGVRSALTARYVVSRVVGFKKIKFYTNENVGSGELDLPEQRCTRRHAG